MTKNVCVHKSYLYSPYGTALYSLLFSLSICTLFPYTRMDAQAGEDGCSGIAETDFAKILKVNVDTPRIRFDMLIAPATGMPTFVTNTTNLLSRMIAPAAVIATTHTLRYDLNRQNKLCLHRRLSVGAKHRFTIAEFVLCSGVTYLLLSEMNG
jgi:hypothetical protein